jgi:hypothetical protein
MANRVISSSEIFHIGPVLLQEYSNPMHIFTGLEISQGLQLFNISKRPTATPGS